MRLALALLIGVVSGYLLGIALSSFTGMIGMTFFDQSVGIEDLPYYFALLGAVIVPLLDMKARNRK